MDIEFLDILLFVEGHTAWFKGMFPWLQTFFWKNIYIVLNVFYLRNGKKYV